jgi:UDP-N-acetylmuramoyl-tripeptide--D-alanyl-D-alanine ligase
VFEFSLIFLIAVGAGFFAAKRQLRYLRYFQQEEYEAGRFVCWLFKNVAFDTRASFVSLIGALATFFACCDWQVALWTCLAVAVLFSLIFFEPDPKLSGKITLKMTERATRIYQVSLVLFVLLVVALFVGAGKLPDKMVPMFWLGQLALFQLLPFLLVLANWLLLPAEKTLQKKFLEEARTKFKKIRPFTIGITGSYGKTSMKVALTELLQVTLGPTFTTPRSINSLMGITREIRTNLKSSHKFAVIEMGAYYVGSIARLCKLTPPNAALVTGVGLAHLERFGSPQNIYKAKSELPCAVSNDGLLVCNGDNAGSRKMADEFRKSKTFLYGLNEALGPLDCTAKITGIDSKGTSLSLSWQGKSYPSRVKLLGQAAVSNLTGAFTMACALGADPAYAAAALANIEPVDNRLSVGKEGEVVYLRDAYNSNPVGFEAALDALKEIPGKRKILMTPGMIELGSEQVAQNSCLATRAASVCDLVILVGPTNRQALLAGLGQGGLSSDKIIVCDGRAQAFDKLNATVLPGDIVLIENDLTDLYESVEKF